MGVKSIIASAVITALVVAYGAFYVTNDHWSAKWSARDLSDQKAQADRAVANLSKLHDDAIAMADIDAKHQQEIAEIQKNANNTIASYRAGDLKLRAQFTCAARGMSEATTSSGVRDAATRCGLSDADVENFVRLAERADVITRQLAEAQSVIRRYYKSVNGEELK
ncbi:MAG: hypothetical protein [Caudoviricetes sp.]|nr:MAG: hypothetical protein [Caudoviricetes sp.]